ncbi:MAG: O-antigen ligase family protein [Actinomycetota bacterium]|nr:O-antigen ligase family protein [Actinomycetota bacterium]
MQDQADLALLDRPDRPRGDSPRRQPVHKLPPPLALALGLIILVVGTMLGLVFGVAQDLFGRTAVIGVAVILGGIMATIAATRFWVVLVVMFVVRSSLDALRLGSLQQLANGALSPSVVVGVVFLASGSAWMIAQWRAGMLYRMSRSTSWFLLFAFACLLSCAGSPDPFFSVQSALKVAAGALMFAVLEQAYRQRPDRIRHLLAATFVSLIVPALVAFQQLTSNTEVEQYLQVSRIQGTFVHPNPFATYLVVVASLALAVRPHLKGINRHLATMALVVASVLTIFTYARGAWIALLLGILVVGAKQDKRLLLGLGLMVVLVVIAVPSVTARLSDLSETEAVGDGDANSAAWRFGYWAELLPRVAENPVTGIGMEQVLAQSPDRLQPHNSFVQAIVETGVLGFVALTGFVVSMALDLRNAIRNASPGLARGVAIGAAAAALGVSSQMVSENLLSQAAIHWYLAVPVAFALSDLTRRRDLERARQRHERIAAMA